VCGHLGNWEFNGETDLKKVGLFFLKGGDTYSRSKCTSRDFFSSTKEVCDKGVRKYG
jgi:hypothetical protein